MAEYRKPEVSGRDGVRSIVVLGILMASIFFGLRMASRRGGLASWLGAGRSTAQVQAGKPDVERGTMNFFEEKLFVVLAFVRAHVVARSSDSWGWAIVLLTAAINLLLLPLRVSSMRSGVKMQRIQPEVQAIKARYKGVAMMDPRHQEMTAEIARLQKDNGVNV